MSALPPAPGEALDHRQASQRTITWSNLALMAFVTVWGFGNVVNNYANQGLTVVFSWIMIMVIYFVPYALMVGEMGATFPEARSGVTSWIRSTMGSGWAYLCGWTYWVVHIPYLAQKPQAILIAGGWAVEGHSGLIKRFPVWQTQIVVLLLFLLFMALASRGVRSLKLLGSIAGMASFVMGILYILLMLAAPAIRDAHVATPNMTSLSTYLPHFDLGYFTTIAMLVFAVGGAEKISPYVNNMVDQKRGFSRGMIALAGMVAVSALLGSIAMGMMFDATQFDAKAVANFKANGQYMAFQKLGQYYGVGNLLMIIQAVANACAQAAVLLISIDAPLKVLLADSDDRYIPRWLRKENRFGAPVNGYLLTAILVSLVSLLPIIGVGNMDELFSNLLDLNAVVMPLRYLFVFAAYVAVRRMAGRLGLVSHYRFVRNDAVALAMGAWCFLFTAAACILGMIPGKLEPYTTAWWNKLLLNVVAPVVFIALGLIMPLVARAQRSRVEAND
ncbi:MULTISPECIES: APC family permease [unclassified Luteococcus]|uniref:APC family permease n=1 Tax=unclassified Luteococcus TaxID=2639923 RepID=UPI00313C2612